MVKKIGQRKFLLKHGYFESELDKMSPSEAKRIIASIEKIEHPQGQRKVYSEKEINAIKEFVEWYKSKVLDERIDTCRIQYFDNLERHETLNCCLLSSEQNALFRLQISLDQDLENFIKEHEVDVR